MNEIPIRPAAETDPLKRLNEALGMPIDTPYEKLITPGALKGEQAATSSSMPPADPTVQTVQSPLPKIEPERATVEKGIIKASGEGSPAASTASDVGATQETGKFVSMLKNHKGMAFAAAAVALVAVAASVKMKRGKEEGALRA